MNAKIIQFRRGPVVKKNLNLNYRILRTFEEMLLQAAPGHELVHKKPVLILVAVADEFDKVWMPQLPKENDFSLSSKNK